MTDICKQKDTADKALDLLYSVCPSAIVAGGAPRDWYLGIPAKDIDIFITADNRWTTSEIVEVLSKLGFEKVTPITPKEDGLQNYTMNPHIRFVYNGKLDDELIQVVVLNDSTYKIVDTFAFNVCKVWYKNSKVNTTPDFEYAIFNKVLIKQGELYSSTFLYRDKIIKKFPDYKYYDSEQNYLKSLFKTVDRKDYK